MDLRNGEAETSGHMEAVEAIDNGPLTLIPRSLEWDESILREIADVTRIFKRANSGNATTDSQCYGVQLRSRPAPAPDASCARDIRLWDQIQVISRSDIQRVLACVSRAIYYISRCQRRKGGRGLPIHCRHFHQIRAQHDYIYLHSRGLLRLRLDTASSR